MEKAHRASYAIFNGEVPPGKMVLHSCDFKLCVNPDHLTAGTHEENMQDVKERKRSHNSLKTECLRGHSLLDPNNLIANKYNERRCRACHRMRSREYQRKYRLHAKAAAGDPSSEPEKV